MKKYFVFGDVHSCYKELVKALEKSGFDINNKNHCLISLGDLFDRGPGTRECLDFILSIPEDRRILIRGNHEDLFEDVLNRNCFDKIDFHNGTTDSFTQLAKMKLSNKKQDEIINCVKKDKDVKKYFSSLVDYAEIGDYIFVHGWIPCYASKLDDGSYKYEYMPDWRNATKEEFEDARWGNPFDQWEQGVKEEGKKIVCGHWWTFPANSKYHKSGSSNLDNIYFLINDHDAKKFRHGEEARASVYRKYFDFDTFMDDGIIALDGCTNISKIVNIFTFEIK